MKSLLEGEWRGCGQRWGEGEFSIVEIKGDGTGEFLIEEGDAPFRNFLLPVGWNTLIFWKITMTGDDGAGGDGIDKGEVASDVVAIAPHDDDIGMKVEARAALLLKEAGFGDQSGIAREENPPTAPVEEDDQACVVGQAITIELGRGVENFKKDARVL